MFIGVLDAFFLEAVANLGDDADITAAVCRQNAGAYYSIKGIPGKWLEKLWMATEITALADRLAMF
jgi:ADP-ribosyl-[dinitrogen reductase] hydrolase